MLKKIKIPKKIKIILILAIVLNIMRVFLFKNYTFLYMFWNIFLAFVPFLISSILLLSTNKENITKPFFVGGFVLWFIFFPNAPYVITDFIHLGRIYSVPVMYDACLLFSSAWVSLLFGLYSLVHIEKMLSLKFSKRIVDTTILISVLFASLGIYIGRFLRYNSWDLFTSPDSLFSSIWNLFIDSNKYTNVYGYIFLFFFFIYMSYLSFKTENTRNQSI